MADKLHKLINKTIDDQIKAAENLEAMRIEAVKSMDNVADPNLQAFLRDAMAKAQAGEITGEAVMKQFNKLYNGG